MPILSIIIYNSSNFLSKTPINIIVAQRYIKRNIFTLSINQKPESSLKEMDSGYALFLISFFQADKLY